MLNCYHKEIKLIYQYVIKYLIIVTVHLGNWYETQRSDRDFVACACVERFGHSYYENGLFLL